MGGKRLARFKKQNAYERGCVRVQNRLIPALLLIAGLCCSAAGNSQTKSCPIELDFSKTEGTIKPLNGVNGGPLSERGWVDLSPYYRELGIKMVRLHDVPWTFDDAVNPNYVFPRFDLDPDRPQNYDFFQTDWYLQSIVSLGIGIIYDLGPTAEFPKLPRRHNHPPKDFNKWARICVNMIKHFNGGWADGHHFNIRYWEIWNEPNHAGFWAGTPQQYYQLYEITAKAIKNYDPTLKVGGPALAEGSLPRTQKFLEGFLKYCKSHNVPLDFLSWHEYGAAGITPFDIYLTTRKIRDLLDQYGFANTESVLDEWSYRPGHRESSDVNAFGNPMYVERLARKNQGVTGAAYDASVLILLQDSPVNIANFYHGATIPFFGMFDEYGIPHKTFYAFKAFKFLLDTPERVATARPAPSGPTSIAGLSPDKRQATILISNYGTECNHYEVRLENLPWRKGVIYKEYVLDKDHNLALVKTGTIAGTNAVLPEDVQVPSVCMIRLKAVAAN